MGGSGDGRVVLHADVILRARATLEISERRCGVWVSSFYNATYDGDYEDLDELLQGRMGIGTVYLLRDFLILFYFCLFFLPPRYPLFSFLGDSHSSFGQD